MVAEFRALNALLSRIGIAGRAGVTYGGERDLYQALGYKKTLQYQDHWDRWDRGDVAGRLVDIFPDYTWRGDIEVLENEDMDTWTTFEQAFYDFAEKHTLWSTFNRLDKLSGVGRYAVLYIVAEGDPGTPLESLPNLDAIIELIPLGESSARIDAVNLVKDPKDPRYGLPNNYVIQTDVTSAVQARTVHHSRCLHVVSEPMESLLYGRPRLTRAWNRLDDLDKVMGGGAEAFWQRAHRGYQFDIDKDMQVNADDKAAMEEAITSFEHNMRRVLRTRGVTTTEFGSDVANFKDPAEAIVSVIAGAYGIPMRLLLGSERGELASTADKKNWDDRVAERQKTIGEPRFIRPFVNRLIQWGALAEPAEFHTKWPDREELTPQEQVDMAAKAAEINTKAGEVVILGEEIRTHYLGLDPFTEAQQQQIAEMEAEAAEAQAEAMAQLQEQNEQQPAEPAA